MTVAGIIFDAPLLIVLAAGYVLGAIPFGLILTRAAGLGDIRDVGSGNIGATNVLRTGRKGLAALTLALDAAKGFAAVLLAEKLLLPPADLLGPAAQPLYLPLAAGFGAVIGHVFPVWLGFKGGKGVATTFGVLLALTPATAAVTATVWLFMLLIFRWSSLAALAAAVVAPFFAFGYAGVSIGILTTALAALIIAKHHGNIRRLLKGEEPKVGR